MVEGDEWVEWEGLIVREELVEGEYQVEGVEWAGAAAGSSAAGAVLRALNGP